MAENMKNLQINIQKIIRWPLFRPVFSQVSKNDKKYGLSSNNRY